MINTSKKTFRIVLMLCTLAITIIGSTFVVHADNSVIDSVTVESVPVPAFGESIVDAKAAFAVPEGCVAESFWIKWNHSNQEFVIVPNDSDDTFTETDIYQCVLKFSLKEGYTFTDEWLTINYPDTVDTDDIEAWSEGDDESEVYYVVLPCTSFATAIYEIDITLPEVVAGNTASVGEIEFHSGDDIISNDNFEIETYWECHTDNYENVTDEAFEADNVYQYHLYITPKAGYYFAESMTVYCNGEEEFWGYETPTYYSFYPDFTTFTPLEKIELAGLPEKEVGATMVGSLEILTDTDDFKVYVDWYDENDDEVTGQAMEDGKLYTVYIEVSATGNTPITEDFIIEIDGTEYTPNVLNLDGGQAFLSFEYDFVDYTFIDSLYVESIPVVSPGDSIPDAKATFGETEGYIAESHWFVWDAVNEEFTEVTDGTFTETDIYYLCMDFTPEFGYTFGENLPTITYADGIDIEFDEWGEGDENGNIAVMHSETPIISFATPIYEIDVTLPEVKAGNIATIGGIVVRSGDEIVSSDNYKITASWICLTDDYNDVTNMPFEADQAYQYQIEVIPKDGYYFDKSLVARYNGVENDSAYDTPTCYKGYPDFSTYKPVEKIELTGLPVGKPGSIMTDTLTLKNYIDYFEVYVAWFDEEDKEVTGEAMEDGKIYTAYIEVNSISHMPISENLILVVDGVEYKPTDIYTNSNQAFLKLQYDFKNPAVTPTPTPTPTPDATDKDASTDKSDTSSSVDTGDSSMVIMWMMVAVLSMGTVLFVRRRKA